MMGRSFQVAPGWEGCEGTSAGQERESQSTEAERTTGKELTTPTSRVKVLCANTLRALAVSAPLPRTR